MIRQIATLLLVTGLVAAVMPLTGCGDEESQIRSYMAPADPPPPVALQRSDNPLPMMAPTASSSAGGFVWTVPDGWREEPATDGITLARIVPNDGDGSFAITVTRLGMNLGNMGMLLQNVNRWRRQLNLPPIEMEQLDPLMSIVQAQGDDGLLVDLPGPFDPGGDTARPDPLEQRILTTIFVDENETWFFKAHADQVTVARHEAAYRQLVQSVRPADGSKRGLSAATPGTQRVFEGRGITGVVPDGWQEVPGSAMRLASFSVGSGDRRADVAITRFPGDVGGVLANVNRWRSEVGLPPVTDMAEQGSRPVQIDGMPATVFQFAAPQGDEHRLRTIVCMAPRGEMTYFIKMTGPNSLLQEQIEAFIVFIHQLRFTDTVHE